MSSIALVWVETGFPFSPLTILFYRLWRETRVQAIRVLIPESMAW